MGTKKSVLVLYSNRSYANNAWLVNPKKLDRLHCTNVWNVLKLFHIYIPESLEAYKWEKGKKNAIKKIVLMNNRGKNAIN